MDLYYVTIEEVKETVEKIERETIKRIVYPNNNLSIELNNYIKDCCYLIENKNKSYGVFTMKNNIEVTIEKLNKKDKVYKQLVEENKELILDKRFYEKLIELSLVNLKCLKREIKYQKTLFNEKETRDKINNYYKYYSNEETLKIDNRTKFSIYVDSIIDNIIPNYPLNNLEIDNIERDNIESNVFNRLKCNKKTGFNRLSIYTQVLREVEKLETSNLNNIIKESQDKVNIAINKLNQIDLNLNEEEVVEELHRQVEEREIIKKLVNGIEEEVVEEIVEEEVGNMYNKEFVEEVEEEVVNRFVKSIIEEEIERLEKLEEVELEEEIERLVEVEVEEVVEEVVETNRKYFEEIEEEEEEVVEKLVKSLVKSLVKDNIIERIVERVKEEVVEEVGIMKEYNNKKVVNQTTNNNNRYNYSIVLNTSSTNDINQTSSSPFDFSSLEETIEEIVKNETIKKPIKKNKIGQHKYPIYKFQYLKKVNISNYQDKEEELRLMFKNNKIGIEIYLNDLRSLKIYKRFNRLLNRKTIKPTTKKIEEVNKSFDYFNFYKLQTVESWYMNKRILKNTYVEFKTYLMNLIIKNSTNGLKWLKTQSNGSFKETGFIKVVKTSNSTNYELYSYGNKVLNLEEFEEYKLLSIATKTFNKNGFVTMDYSNNSIIYPNLLSRSCKQHIKQFDNFYNIFSNLKSNKSIQYYLDKTCNFSSIEEIESYIKFERNELITIAIYSKKQNKWFNLDSNNQIKGLIKD